MWRSASPSTGFQPSHNAAIMRAGWQVRALVTSSGRITSRDPNKSREDNSLQRTTSRAIARTVGLIAAACTAFQLAIPAVSQTGPVWVTLVDG